MLIRPDSQWPPPGAAKMRKRWPSWRAWWSGDFDELRKHAPATAPNGYWAKRDRHPEDRQVHLPLAADIARTSAELVFGDTQALDFGPLQDSWEELAQDIGWTNSLLEAGEVDAALGGVFLRPAWDKAVANHPLLTAVPVDEALPEFRFGMLWQVTFVTELGERDGFWWRWLEHHERGQIRHELWKGTATNIGRAVALADQPETAPLAAGEDGGLIDTTPIRPDGGLLVDYIPNDLPQPLDRLPFGRSDLQGIESALDMLDTTWDSWMRDLDLGKGRVIVSSEMLDGIAPAPRSTGHVQTATDRFFGRLRRGTPTKVFDEDAKVFTPLPGLPPDDGGKVTPITHVQFQLRVQEHADTAMALVEQIVSRAGYAPQTFGQDVDGQISGTSRRLRERRTYTTRNRKRRYARSAIERTAETLMLIAATDFGGERPTERPKLDWRDTDQSDPKETAETINTLRMAEAMSTEIAVRMAHPDWDDTQVKEEVGRIKAERATAPAPSGFETPDQLDDEEPQA
ncbi:phage portal protein [Amycolatopsis thermophila]|uniref:Phage portal protein n=1 Tax=Amycolatopsis thermophila TaxID=206084 RepID=A0ABU0ERM2_9PSEU|nr:phage portal protein [Amycolatopsis thermophila]MDQ0377945.1 hypothetical protein [Amycolatopsis thermophila]